MTAKAGERVKEIRGNQPVTQANLLTTPMFNISFNHLVINEYHINITYSQLSYSSQCHTAF